MYHPTADRPIEHPLGCLQTACALLTRLAAAQQAYTTPVHDFMNEHHAARPWMPGIKNFPFLGPVGVMLPSCTMRSGHTLLWVKTRLWVGRCSGLEPLLPSRFCPGYTTITSGYNFRKGQVQAEEAERSQQQNPHIAAPKNRRRAGGGGRVALGEENFSPMRK